jgi:hypothetical protein
MSSDTRIDLLSGIEPAPRLCRIEANAFDTAAAMAKQMVNTVAPEVLRAAQVRP